MTLWVLVLLAACGDKVDDDDVGDDTALVEADDTAATAPFELPSCGSYAGSGPWRIPDPGDAPDASCLDREPNDTPDDAVACGLVDAAFGAALYSAGELGPDDPVDWFVFKTGEHTELIGQYSWWDETGNLLDQVLYEVVDDCTDLVEVHRWDSDSGTGEHTSHTDPATVRPGAIYALELVHVEGEGDWFT